MSDRGRGRDRAGLRERLFGGPRHLGLWTLPLFLGVGLLGAVLAGALATVLYTQRVASLERETAAARAELGDAVERVTEAAEEGIEAIRREAQSVLDDVAQDPPVSEAIDAGVVAVRVTVHLDPPPSPPPDDGGTEGDDDEEGGEEAGGEEEAPPPPARTRTRFGSGVAVVLADGRTFVATSYAVVADPLRPGQAVERAEILVGDTRLEARVRSWHPERDLALLETDAIPGLSLAEWRPADEPLTAGDVVHVVGLLPSGATAVLTVTIAAADGEVHLLDAPISDLVRGGAVLDGRGRLVAVASNAYAAYRQGPQDAGVPVLLLCERLVRCGDDDIGTSPDEDGD